MPSKNKASDPICAPSAWIARPTRVRSASDRVINARYGGSVKPIQASVGIYVDRQFARDLRGDETKARVCVLKNRDGMIGQIEARFNVSSFRFETATSGVE
jgi:hypothetical protein